MTARPEQESYLTTLDPGTSQSNKVATPIGEGDPASKGASTPAEAPAKVEKEVAPTEAPPKKEEHKHIGNFTVGKSLSASDRKAVQDWV